VLLDSPPPVTAPVRIGERELLAVLTVVALGYSIMQTLVLPALPTFQRAFGVGTTTVAWVASGFFLASATSIPVVSRLGDVHGKVRVLTWVMVLLGVSTALAAVAPSFGVLLVARVGQGVSAAVFPLGFGILRDELPVERVGRGVGVISSMFGVGSAVGYVLSGPLIQAFSWRALFVAGLIPVAAAAVLLPRLPRSPRHPLAGRDWLGGTLLSLGLLAGLIALSEGNRWGWTSPATVGMLLAGIALIALWAAVEYRVADPLIDMRLVTGRAMARLNLSGFLVGYAMFAIYTVLPGLLVADPARVGFGFAASPLAIGTYYLPLAVVMLVTGPLSGRERFDPVLVLRFGLLAMTGALLELALLHDHPIEVYAGMALMGLGTAPCLTSMARLVNGVVTMEQTGVAGGVNTLMRLVGGAVAAQAGAAIVAAAARAAGHPAERGYVIALGLAAACGAAAVLSTLSLETRARTPPPG
jgi:MFS family permease